MVRLRRWRCKRRRSGRLGTSAERSPTFFDSPRNFSVSQMAPGDTTVASTPTWQNVASCSRDTPDQEMNPHHEVAKAACLAHCQNCSAAGDESPLGRNDTHGERLRLGRETQEFHSISVVLYISQRSLEARVLHRYRDNFVGNVLDLEIGCREGSRIPGPPSASPQKRHLWRSTRTHQSSLANTCIESTSRFAMELDYHVTLVRDATAAFNRT